MRVTGPVKKLKKAPAYQPSGQCKRQSFFGQGDTYSSLNYVTHMKDISRTQGHRHQRNFDANIVVPQTPKGWTELALQGLGWNSPARKRTDVKADSF